ncbi:outer membrane lipid asymmetry maintenance protein MlaD [Geomonas sp. Red32]|uniref:outer membrane lipid asymmetry maintenance protein MlaD n=1 Tax=Geomonas sp. Red32 TaxID=2912856 RepID=UPI00202D014D|nr:outer membrane lipid asymmetry maintenance protein MlaD [Geomonas sp. Red32]MCM0082742.1 outer membrane lipid asymmetry maintenance protein MlaD [Geomonas sp. Red32]
MDTKKVGLDTLVGVFVLVGILCLGYLSIRLGKLEIVGGDNYRVYALFDSVSGLKKGASVEIAGVEVGQVDSIGLDPKQAGRARVVLKLQRSVKLQDDVIASVRTRGIIGDKFILLRPGGSDTAIGPGGVIRETESSVDLEDLLSKYIHGKVD